MERFSAICDDNGIDLIPLDGVLFGNLRGGPAGREVWGVLMEIEIKTINDMMKIPVEKFDEFLAGFVEVAKITRATFDLMATVAEATGKTLKEGDISMPCMVWKDDGKRDITINIVKQPDEK